MPTPHPNFTDYYRLLSSPQGQTLFGRWDGDVFRFSPPRWVSRPYRLTGGGALREGGRWNNRNLIPANYFSTSPETAMAEADAKAARYGWRPQDMRTQTRIIVGLTVQAVLDLTNANTLAALGVTTAEIISCDWATEQNANREAMTQAIGRAVFETLGEGLLVPSARRAGGTNLVYFGSHRRDGTAVVTHDEENIPFVHGLP